jgi:predicted O-methyltransferase YrrM
MTKRSIGLDEALHDYLLDVSLREPDLLAELRHETAAMPQANMQIAPEQGQFMALLARLIGTRRYLEVGTFTGYSALAVMMALPEHAEATCLDISEEWTAIAERYWIRAGLNERMHLHLAPASETMARLLREGWRDDYDFAFIDADKTGYVDYFEACLQLVRPGGLILVDNTLWDGRVADESAGDEDTNAIRTFNRHVAADERVDLSLLPLADGVTLLRKRA